MKNESFTTAFLTTAKPEKVFDAINNVRAWWSENISGDTENPGSEFEYHYQDVHRAKMKIKELVRNKKVIWHVLENHFNFTKDQTEWTGTDVIFDISEKDGKTQLLFSTKD